MGTAAPVNSQPLSSVDVEANVLPLLLDEEPVRIREVRLDFVREAALGIPELQRRQAVAVDGGVNIGRIGVEVLADDQARLAMRLLALADEPDVGRERDVAADPLPRVVKRVARPPTCWPRCRRRCRRRRPCRIPTSRDSSRRRRPDGLRTRPTGSSTFATGSPGTSAGNATSREAATPNTMARRFMERFLISRGSRRPPSTTRRLRSAPPGGAISPGPSGRPGGSCRPRSGRSRSREARVPGRSRLAVGTCRRS